MKQTASAQAQRGTLALTLTASGGTFLAMLDSTVTNLAVPDMQHDFTSASLPALSWVISGYAVLFAALLTSAGLLADVLGRRRLFVGGIITFTLASLLCALAPSLPVLVATRMLQGAGAAAMIPASLAILLLDGPADQRVKSIGIWSAASAFAAAVGPSVGGVLVESLGWRSVFYINLPFGVLLTVAALTRIPRTVVDPAARRFPDPLGTVLLTLGIGALTLGITEGSDWGWLDLRTLAVFVAGVLAVGVVVPRSLRHRSPAIDLSLLGHRPFAVTNLVSLLYGMAQYPWLLASVICLTNVWHYSELDAGLAMTPGAVTASVAALAMSRLAPKVGGPRTVAIAGLAVFLVCGVWLVLGLGDTPAFWTLWFPVASLAGIGMGLVTMGTAASAAFSAPPVRFATASGLNTTARQFGGALGIAAFAVFVDGHRKVDSASVFTSVFVFSTVVVVIGLVLAVVALRPAPPAAAVPAPAAPPAGADGTPSTRESAQPN
ncbi:DHA2 family efflux MFS transporter permease subunit [Kitasatospora sp. NPDC056076]|uniref:DHA2 family efflux MFS transporter permease subunit n=1 Tax=Kitasatospora sp. NPDC056076 TaxID=3345703 RepID=UPI0035E082E2